MSEPPFIRCPGCETLIDPTRTACPGCGRCPACGVKRARTVKTCSKCDIPYCSCCGRCPQCLELRYSEIGPCECGHPRDAEQIEDLVKYHAASGAETRPGDSGCILVVVILLILFFIGMYALKG